MIEIKLTNDDSFSIIRETLTRIGIANNRERKLYQSCHILQKMGRYYVVHFKELLELDGRQVNITDEDLNRRDDIALLLEEWGLCDLIDPDYFDEEYLPQNHFRVISHRDKENWTLIHKYRIGK